MDVILDHLNRTIRPALRSYAAAEAALTTAQVAKDEVATAAAREAAMLAARQAVDVLHHLADFVWKEPDPALPTFSGLDEVRAAVRNHCFFLREPSVPIDDVTLLRDVAVALKHHRPDRGSVASSQDIVTIGSGWGTMRYGEAKWGGIEQVIVVRKDGSQRAVIGVCQNVFDAWMEVLGQPIGEINVF